MLVVGFHDGVVRILQLMKPNEDDGYERGASENKAGVLLLEQALKPHSGRVTCCLVDVYCNVLATAVIIIVHIVSWLRHWFGIMTGLLVIVDQVFTEI